MKSKFCFHSIAVYDGFSFCRLKRSIISECDKKEPRKNKKDNYSFLSLYTAVDMDLDYSLFRDVSENVRKVFGKLLLLTRLKGGSCMQRSSVRGDCLFCTLHLSIEKALRWKGDPRTHSMRIL